MRGSFPVIAAGCLIGGLLIPTARAQEPLFLRIRPNEAAPSVPGAAGAASDEDAAAQARARREAVWARSDARARIAIASVCTGCMKPMPPAPVMPAADHDTTASAPNADMTGEPVPPATLLATAGQP